MPYQIEYNIDDNDNDPAKTSVWVATGQTVANYTLFAKGYALLIDGIIKGVFRQVAKLKIPVDISGLTNNVADALSDVEQVSHFEFVTAQGNPVDFNIPCIDETKIIAGSDELDQTDAAIAAIIAMFEDGIDIGGGTFVQPCNVAEEDVVGTLIAHAHTRNSGKRR